MVPSADGDANGETHDELEPSTAPLVPKPRDEIRVEIPPLEAGLLDQRSRRKRLLDFLRARPSREWLTAPFSIFRRAVDEKEEASRSVPSPAGIRRRFHMRFMRKINWSSLGNICKEWMQNPMNVALLLWLVCVACFLSLLFLLLTGLVDDAFPTKSLRNHWLEICNQVLNALFTLMSLYQHPVLFHHLALLFRWRSEDIIELRKLYCKNAAYRPREWAHMMVVVFLLHVTCFAQYVLCGLYWGYSRSERPELVENSFVAVGIVAPVIAGAYTVYSPLGREYDSDQSDEESSRGRAAGTAEAKRRSKLGLKLYDRRVVVSRPEWVGGLFDLRDDLTVAYLSFFCTCCVFGWNMERLGFGNMYVHIMTFVLLCIAPYWIFSISALNIHDDVIRRAVKTTGLVLSMFCLLYGGFWRVQIRKRFKLPANSLCCGIGSLTDYVQWMFCWACSLAQEVRTGNFYDVEDDSLYRKQHVVDGGDDEDSQQRRLPLLHAAPSECDSPLPTSHLPFSPSAAATNDETMMVPPVPPLIQLEDEDCNGAIDSSEPIETPVEDTSPPHSN